MPNRLADETSPYLLRNGSNPVDWYPWGEEAWSRAAAEDKPVLLSIGYASCHWCHVMERESFADPEIAALLNRDFVCIKVDREERPDLDSLYIEALQTLTGSAGWPLTAFLTPKRKLFFGGTYFPPSPRDDLPSFRSVIESVAEEWRDSRRELERQAEGVLREMRDRDKTLPERRALNADLLDQGILRVQSTADQVHGGFGPHGPHGEQAPKFPQPWLVELMLRAAVRGPGGAHGIADLTLRRMARGGVYDQIGGGFHRYAVDAAWRIPHFEKMLSDNALLARLYTHAWQARHDPLFARIAVETLEYLLRELRAPAGGFFAGQDSDSDGAEGGFYTWSYDEVMGVAPEAAGFYGITPGGNFEGRNVPAAAGDNPPGAARAKLAAARASRTRPGRDEKILTSWNGLAIAALAEAGAAFGRPDFGQAAEQAAGFLMEHAASGAGELLRSFPSGSAKGGGLAEDYAYLGDGLFTLWEATGDPRWTEACERLARKMLALFWDDEGGGIFSTAATGERLLLRRKDFIDATTPSPNGVAALLLQRLGVLLDSEDLGRAGVEILEAAQPVMQAIPQESGTLFAALDFHLSGPREIAVVGDRGEPLTSALLREVWTRFLPNRVLAGSAFSRAFGEPEGDTPGGLTGGIASPLLEGRSALEGRPTAYVCEHHTCKRPTSDPTELGRQLHVGGTPSPDQVNRAADLARFTLHRISLFDHLDNPLWIDPLRERGFFTTPPAPIDHYVPGATGSPPWPDSKYLARMAGVDPFAVHRVALEIPETGNSLVHEDLADAALALPADLAADFALAARGWLRSSQHHVMLPRKLGSLMSSLARAGHGEPALDLARALFELLPDAAADSRALASEEGFPQPPQPRARFGPWDYEQILNENFPDVVRALQVPALDLLADLLVSALELSQVEPGAAVGVGSYLWRPAIGDDPRNLDRSVRNSLVSALRDAAELIARENPGMLPDLYDRLERRGWPVFRRIGLHLLGVFPEDAPARVEEVLADRSLLDDPNYSREYLLLARQHLSRPPEARRSPILEWVQAGPDLARWDAVPDRWASDPDDGEEAGRYARDWSSTRLAYLETPPGRDDPQDATFAFPPRDPPVDLTTPKQADWLRTASMAEITRFCRTWRAPGSVGAPTPAGLQKKLVEVVTSDPRRYAAGATELVDLPAEYLRAVVIGLREAARQGTSYPWEPVLELFASVASFASVGQRKTAGDGALRVSIARCLAAGFAQGAGEIPHEHRRLVWEILRPIPAEPEPEPAAAPGSEGAPPPSAAEEGLQAAVRYALWVRRHLESQPHGRELARRGWDEMPEVREALEARLDPGRRSPAVQAVYGQWFPWLLMLDPSWAAAHRESIFPPEADPAGLRRAAWDAYLAVSPVFDQVFELLFSDYEQAVEDVAARGAEGLTRPEQGLAEHLITLYLRGRIPLEGTDSLLARFLDRASELPRAHALAYVGQMVQGQQDRIPAEIILRLQRLWESRMDAARRAEGVEDRQEELAQFGTWFASGKFEAGWAVRQLLDLLTLTGRVGNTSKVVERLKTYMETMPYEVVRCIAALVARERGAITILGWGPDAQQMLSRIVASSDPRARDVALDLLDTFDLQPVTELIRWG